MVYKKHNNYIDTCTGQSRFAAGVLYTCVTRSHDYNIILTFNNIINRRRRRRRENNVFRKGFLISRRQCNERSRS